MSCLLWRHWWMTFYAKSINRPLALEGWFEKPKNRLFGHVRVKVLCQNVCGDNRFFFHIILHGASKSSRLSVSLGSSLKNARWPLFEIFVWLLFFRVVVPSTYSPHRPGFISNERTCRLYISLIRTFLYYLDEFTEKKEKSSCSWTWL